jgi:hypothetical protein
LYGDVIAFKQGAANYVLTGNLSGAIT